MAKSPNAFRTISEAAEEIGAPQHVLRFWETKFTFVEPMKRAGGRRFYRAQDIDILKGVRRLLHDEGLTIRGVQLLYRQHGLGRIVDPSPPLPAADPDSPASESRPPAPDHRPRLKQLLTRLEAAQARLNAALQA